MIPKNLIKLFLIAFLSSFLFSVETTSNFKGIVTDLSGNALENAEITIVNNSTNKSANQSFSPVSIQSIGQTITPSNISSNSQSVMPLLTKNASIIE